MAVRRPTPTCPAPRALRPLARCLVAAGCMAASLGGWAQDEPKTMPYAPAQVEDTRHGAAMFRRLDGVLLTPVNSGLPPTADEGLWHNSLWRDSRGLPDGARVKMSISAAQAPADGRTSLTVLVQAVDVDGNPIGLAPGGMRRRIRLETSHGRWQVPGVPGEPGVFSNGGSPGAHLKTTPDGQPVTELAAVEVLLNDKGEVQLPLIAPATPGPALLRASSGAVGVQGEIRFVPDRRPMIMVGIVEGAINVGKVSKSDPAAPALAGNGFEEGLRRWSDTNSSGERTLAGRAAVFVKGEILGEYLLTAALDSDKDTREKLFRDVDPNAYYPIYGDASIRQFDAQAKGPVYVRIDKDRSYLLYGDIRTATTESARRLANYQRSLTGAQWHYENQTVRVEAFAAKDATRHLVDEQPGRGISGPYALGQPNAVVNSEIVELIVRDRNAPAVILRRQLLVRQLDYDFEPFSGRLLFRQPVPSVDENLNPVSIRVAYEVDEGAASHWVGGVDAAVRVGERITLGASIARDRHPVAPYRLGGVYGEMRVGAGSHVVAEVARSTGNQYVNRSLAAAGSTPGVESSGSAARIEWRHDGEQLQARAHVAGAQAGFQNPAGGLAPGRREAGARGQWRIDETWSVHAELLRTEDRSGTASDGARRDAASVGTGIRLNDALRVDLSLNRVQETQLAGSAGVLSAMDAQLSSVPGLGWNSNSSFGLTGSGLLASPAAYAALSPNAGAPALVSSEYTSVRARLTGRLNEAATLYGELEFADADRQRMAIGGEYRLDAKSRAYARHEFADSLTANYGLTRDGSRSQTTVLGIDTAYMKDGQVFSEYRLAGAQHGRDAAAAIGVRNLWRVAAGLNLTTALERQHLNPAAATSQQATAVSLGADYTGDALYKLGGRLEFRTAPSQDTWLSTLAYDRKLDDNWAALLRNLYIRHAAQGTAIDNGTQTQDRLQLGLAYRDTQINLWHALGRLEYRTERSTAIGAPSDSDAWIASLHGNTRPARQWTIAGQLAVKTVDEATAAPTGALSGAGVPIATLGPSMRWRGSLLGARAIWDFAERFDASLYVSLQTARGQRLRGLGAELGYRVMDNLWLSAGYSGGRYSDVDAFSSNQSWTGWHLRLRFKFDEKTFFSDDGRVNRTRDDAPSNPRQWRE